MNILDIRTVLFSYGISNAICLAVMASLWSRNRRGTPGLVFWLADFGLQFLAVLLIALRGILPDIVSILFGTPLILAGTLLLYIGLERYVGKTSSQRINFILVGVLILIHAFFSFVQPSLLARNLIFSAGLLAICSQCAWLLLRRVDSDARTNTKMVGVVFVIYALVSLLRFFVDLAIKPGNDLFQSDVYDTLVILVYQMLFIGLTFALVLMVNRRLFGVLEMDITERKKAEKRIDFLARFPSENPTPTLRLDHDGTILYANPASQGLLADWGTNIGKHAPSSWMNIVTEALAQQTTKTVDVQRSEHLYTFYVVPVVEENYVNLYSHDVTEQKLAEETLSESEQRYRSLFENMLNGFAYCQMLFKDGQPEDFVYLDVNAAFEKLTGLKGVTGKKVSEAIPGIRQSDPRLFEIYGRVAMTGQSETFETFVEALKMWFSISVYSPQREYFVAVFDVITDRKQMEAALRESETNFRALAENAGEGILVAVEGGVHLFANHAMTEISGYSVDELLKLNMRELSHPDETAIIAERLKRRLAGESIPGEYETAIVGKDGRKIPVEISSNKTVWKGQPADIVFVRDITERKRAEETLRDSEMRLREAQEMAHLGFWRWDVKTGDVEWSEEVFKIFGLDPKKFTPQIDSILAMSPWPEDHQRDKELINRAIETHNPGDYEQKFLRPDQSIGHYYSTFQGNYDENGELESIVGTVLDITERKLAEEKLQSTLEELKRSNSELEQFAYVASHDLQEPLRMVSSYVQLLERRYKGSLDKDADDFIGFAVDGAERMQRLINDLLAYSRLGTRSQPFAPASCEAALDMALDNLKVAIQDSKARISHNPLPEVVGDEMQLVQLFQNLVGNALKFHGKKAPLVHVSAESKAEEWLFSVHDNGIGIDPQYAERIFIIFQRLHGRDQYEGTGIGLAICKRIVQRHGGRIWVESTVGNGATFFFTVPKKGSERV